MGNSAKLRYDAASNRAADAIRLAIAELRIAASHAPTTSNAYDAAHFTIRELRQVLDCGDPMAEDNFTPQAREPYDWGDD